MSDQETCELIFRYWSDDDQENYDKLISFSKDFLTGNLKVRDMTFLIGKKYANGTICQITTLLKLLKTLSNNVQYCVLGNPNHILTVDDDTKKTYVIMQNCDSISGKQFIPTIKSLLGDDQFIANTLCGECRMINNNFHVIVDSNVDFSKTINRPANVLHIEYRDFDKIDSIMTTLNGRQFFNEFRNFILEYNPNKRSETVDLSNLEIII
jgi:hypothetical protein